MLSSIIQKIIDFFQTSDNKAYRQRKGGKWYKIVTSEESGWSAGRVFWTNKEYHLYDGPEILETEDYTHTIDTKVIDG